MIIWWRDEAVLLTNACTDALEEKVRDAQVPLAEDTTASKATGGSNDHSKATTGSAAWEILSLLAKELPRLVDCSNRNDDKAEDFTSTAPERRKRRRTEGTAFSDSTVHELRPICLPSMQALEPVINAYFTHVHPIIPMIHEGRFRQRLGNPGTIRQLESILLAMGIAAEKYLDEDNGDHSAEVVTEDQERLRKWVVASAMETMSLESLQALVIIAWTDVSADLSIEV